ncbi:MAG TPA: thymidine phosphorylase [Acidimicrobiales bacterium]|jgi:thymidine phosphorylase|nr:thymidine phosphorylase [Acidimicrobiales bacterium]
MNPVDVIRTKRDGGELSDDDIRAFLAAYTAGDVADEQASALLMAIFFRGLSDRELATWTAAMIASGERLDLSGVERPTVDKHSTGGVGDKLSLPLVPLVAACGAAVPQLSGRGLGHTGGTLDKMESIPGWRAALSNDEIVDQLRSIGGVICAAGAGLAPADRKLYALRDVTATVESIPLIASSIMSKKIAEGTSALVLDVKVGSGAFMKEESDARRLAETMVGLGAAHGVRATAFLTRMDTPLGRAVGHAVEVAEAVDVLGGDGPADVVELTVALAGEMVALAGLDADPAVVLRDGAARAMWHALVRAQSGDPDAPLPAPTAIEPVRAPAAGYVTRLDALAVGVAAWRLGAGRSRKADPVSATAGIVCLAKEGDAVEEGQPVLELHVDDAGRVASAREALAGAFDIAPEPPETRPLVIDVLRG